MQAVIERCCGLDVHQETVVACLLIGAAGARARKEVRTFRTVRRELEALRDWLKAAGVTHVGMESTGVYWRPVYAVLEGHVELIVGNARHIRNMPGRKTDVKDAEWREHANCWGVIRPPLRWASGRRSRAGSHDGYGGKRPRACRSARRCARRGRAAGSACSSASAAPWPCARR